MKRLSGDGGWAGRLTGLAQMAWRALRVAAMGWALLVVPLAANGAKAAPPDETAHVYLLRGVLNIFSLGLDEIGEKLEAQGIRVTIANYLSWSSLADQAAAEYRSGRTKTIILVGHSSGATALPDMVARLDELGAPVKLAIGLDSVFHTSLAGHVGRYINYYVANGAGTPVAKTAQLRGALENVDVGNLGIGHLTIDKNEMMQQRVISAIDAVVLGNSKRPAGRQAPGLEQSRAKRSSGTADASAADRR